MIYVEVWKIIEDFPDYQVSNFGMVKSLKFGKERILKQIKNNKKYFGINLSKNGKQKFKLIHSIIFETFNNYKLKDNECVHHIDFIKENNFLGNLKLMTIPEHHSLHNKGKIFSEEHRNNISKNHADFKGKIVSEETKIKISKTKKEKFKSGELNNKKENNPMFGIHRYGKDNPNFGKGIEKEKRVNIKIDIEKGLTQIKIAKKYGVSQSTISNIKTEKIFGVEND